MMDHPCVGSGCRSPAGSAWCLVALLAAFALGCESSGVRHEVRKPVARFETQPAGELDLILGSVRSEREHLRLAAAAIERRRRESVTRLALAAGDDYQTFLKAPPGELRIRVADLAGEQHTLAVHLRELAQHAAHLEAVERRLILLDAVIAEAEAHQRLLANYGSVQAPPPPQHATLLGKLDAIARQPVELPANLTPEAVAGYVTDQLTVERQSAQRRERELAAEQESRRRATEQDAQRRADEPDARRRADGQAAAIAAAAHAQREEAARQAWLEASRRTAETAARRESQRLVSLHRAAALKRYADAYHLFFQGRYADAAVLLDEAIALDAGDPRFHYFRGLAHLRQGQTPQAMADFRVGGELEQHGSFGVGQSLERIQGPERGLIERFRR